MREATISKWPAAVPEIASFVQCHADVVVGDHRVGLQPYRLFQRRDRLGPLFLARACYAEIQLGDGDGRLAGDDLLEQRNRALKGSVFDCLDGGVQRIRGPDAVLRIDAGDGGVPEPPT